MNVQLSARLSNGTGTIEKEKAQPMYGPHDGGEESHEQLSSGSGIPTAVMTSQQLPLHAQAYKRLYMYTYAWGEAHGHAPPRFICRGDLVTHDSCHGRGVIVFSDVATEELLML